MPQLYLGLNAPGLGTYKSAWRRDGIDPVGLTTGEFYVRLAQTAEQGLFDAFFLADQPTLDAASVVRTPGRPRVLALPGASLTLASTDEEALRRKEELDGGDGALSGRQYLAGRLGLSADDLDLDAPIPLEKVDIERQRRENSEGFLRSILSLAASGKPLRELLRDGSGHLTVVGSPATVADTFEQWFAVGAIDGFNLMFDVIEESLLLFVDEVVPLLQERGLFRRKYEGTTLRDHLGLPVPTW